MAGGADLHVVAYDEEALALARGYMSLPLAGARWSLGNAVVEWCGAVAGSARQGTVLVHPERGGLTLAEVVVANAHDVAHHRWDIARTLRRPPGP